MDSVDLSVWNVLVAAVNEDAPLVVVGADGRPCAMCPSGLPRKVAVLDSSFNPPTLAHNALLNLSAAAIAFDMKILMLGKANADKKLVGAQLDQRLAMMQKMALAQDSSAGAAPTALSVSLLPRFVDKVRDLLRLLGDDPNAPVSTIYFIVGSDTIVRIFNPQYYKDPEKELGELFRMAHIISFDRDEKSIEQTREALDTSLGRQFKERITLLKMDASLQSISSTQVRQALQGGGSLSELLLPGVESFVRANPEMYASL
jgi:nicotinic acid mononucleotide adenylyltransferase